MGLAPLAVGSLRGETGSGLWMVVGASGARASFVDFVRVRLGARAR